MQIENNRQQPEDEILFQVGFHHLMNRSAKILDRVTTELDMAKEEFIAMMKNTIQNQTPKLSPSQNPQKNTPCRRKK